MKKKNIRDKKLSILIPTIKIKEELQLMIDEIKKSLSWNKYEIITSNLKESASINRNFCLKKASGYYIIMLDDDITGFYRGWDYELIKTLNNTIISIVSPQLVKENGQPTLMMGHPGKYEGKVQAINNVACTSCIAFRKSIVKDIKFDENFIGSGFEDNDFMLQINKKFPLRKVIFNNSIKLVHLNKMKNQKGSYWRHNKKYFLNKWKDQKDVWHN